MLIYPTQPPAEAVLLTEHQKAAEIQVSVSFLRKDRMRAEPKVPFVKIGGNVRYPRLSSAAD